ncbi:MAG: BMP family ABC transporter substrate-binding protein, partial [Bdellovibrionales bacterium]|nr:BMP family ABC transporter substrate-binding protein [Bdellovibrionales bacterium]
MRVRNLCVWLGVLVLSNVSAAWSADSVRVALVLDKGGRDDKSFNAAAFRGASDAQKKFGVQVKTIEATDDNAIEPMLRSLAQKDFGLIIGVGVAQADAMKKVAAQF